MLSTENEINTYKSVACVHYTYIPSVHRFQNGREINGLINRYERLIRSL